MQLTPRYDDPSFLQLDLPLGDVSVPLLRQRRRLVSTLEGLVADHWATGSRCEEWSVQDVAAHLVSTNQFWAFSIGAALAGEPTRFLATFDPVATPAELVHAVRSQSPAEVLDQLAASNDTLAEATSGLSDADWSRIGEAPPGHVSLRAVALHALWDSWVHERDIALPLGLDPVDEADEIAGCLAYAASLSPAFSVAGGSTRTGAVAIAATEPDVSVVVEVGESVRVRSGNGPADALSLTGPAVDLLEGLSLRAPLPCPVPDEHRWLVNGLAEVFDRQP